MLVAANRSLNYQTIRKRILCDVLLGFTPDLNSRLSISYKSALVLQFTFSQETVFRFLIYIMSCRDNVSLFFYCFTLSPHRFSFWRELAVYQQAEQPTRICVTHDLKCPPSLKNRRKLPFAPANLGIAPSSSGLYVCHRNSKQRAQAIVTVCGVPRVVIFRTLLSFFFGREKPAFVPESLETLPSIVLQHFRAGTGAPQSKPKGAKVRQL